MKNTCNLFNIFILLILLFLIVVFHAPVQGQARENLFFEQYGPANGLSDNKIWSLYKDSEDIIWVGASNGLYKYDGYDFKKVKPKSSRQTSISGNIVSDIVEDNQNNIWIGTWGNGLNRFDKETNSFKKYINNPQDSGSISHNWIISMFVDSKDRLWVGTQNGLNLYLPEENKFQRYITDLDKSPIPSDLRISSLKDIEEDQKGNLWIASYSGLLMFDPVDEEYHHYTSKSENPSIPSDSLESVFIDESNTIWIGAHKEPFSKIKPEYYPDTVILNTMKKFDVSEKEDGLGNNWITDIVSDEEGNLWLATEGGLTHFNPVTETFKTYKKQADVDYSLSSNLLRTLLFDKKNQILWVGTRDNGINKLDFSYEKFEDHFPVINKSLDVEKKFVKAIYQDKNKNYWIGTDFGILQFDRNLSLKNSFSTKTGNNIDLKIGGVTGFFEDSLGNLWISSWGKGLHRKLKNSDRFAKFTPKIDNDSDSNKYQPGGSNIRTMKLNSDGNAWFGTSFGTIDKFNPYDKTFEHYSIFDRDSLQSVPVVSLAFQNKNIIWAGAIENGGLTRINQEKNSIRRYFSGPGKDQLPSNEILSLFVDSKENLWIGTDEGLVLYDQDNHKFQTLATQRGLPEDPILSINQDLNGYLWLSTYTSLIKYHPKDSTVIFYDASEGVKPNLSTSFCTEDGKMLFGGQEGLTLFEPGKVSVNKLEPNIIFTDFKIKNKSVNNSFANSPLNKHINYASKITLNHDESFFSIYFSALNYSHTNNNQYTYMLEGLENKWNYAGNERSASYANVPPGNYKFRVIASNNNGIWNNTGRVINIEILPPWWKTNWAYSAYVLIIVLFIILITKIISLREQMKSEFRLQKMEYEQQQELLKKEHEVDQMKLQFLTNIAHEFRTPLTLVLSPISDILTSMNISPEVSGHLELARKSARRLLRLINQILDFSRVEAGFMKLEVRYGNFSSAVENICQSFMFRAKQAHINYTWDVSHQKAFGYFDYDKVEKILSNIISNAFTFTAENGTIKIEVQYDYISDTSDPRSSDLLVKKADISIKDNGEGIPKEKLGLIFNRFSQAHEKGSGTGIGLSLAKSLAIIHKGDIDVFSEVNKGTTFHVFIPLSRDAFPEDAIQDNDSAQNLDALYEDVDFHSQFKPEEVEILLDNDAPVLLIVEDEEDMQHYIKAIFRKKFLVYTANNGLEGFEMAKKVMPDIVISDIMMPVMDGVTLTKRLKETKETSHVFIILLTAKISKEDKLEGFETGADDYISKPFESDELRLKVTNIIETRRKFQEQFSLNPQGNLNKLGFNLTDKKIMEQIINVINENLNNADLDHKFLCNQLGMSRAQLYRKVRALTNQSVHDFIRNVRLSKALELILDGWLSVSEVMYKVGFNNQSYFAKCFKEKYGKSPNEYIRK